MKYLIKLVSATLVLANLSGCAAMFHGTSQQIAIRSNDQNAEIFVNEAYIGKGSGVTIFKKNKSYTITVRKEGCTAVTIPVTKSFDATTLLGVLIDFGIITILVVDGVGTGAWQQFDQTSYIIDPNCAIGSASTTPLKKAASESDTTAIEYLLSEGKDVNMKDKDGTTSLMQAAKDGHTASVKALIDGGADVNTKDNKGWTTLMSAAGRGQTEVVELLIGNGAEINAKNKYRATAIMIAAYSGHTESVKALIDGGADVNTKGYEGWTALLYAADNGHTEIVKALIDAGADVTAKSISSWTALLYAAKEGHTEIVDILEHAGAKYLPLGFLETPVKSLGHVGVGIFDADEGMAGEFFLDLRFGWPVSRHVLAGGMFSWMNESRDDLLMDGIFQLRNPNIDVFPFFGFVQIPLFGLLPVIDGNKIRLSPYIGAAAGYNVVFLEADNFETDIAVGPGWQAWVGAYVRLRIRGVLAPAALGFEVFRNSGDVSFTTNGSNTLEFRLSGIGYRFSFASEI